MAAASRERKTMMSGNGNNNIKKTGADNNGHNKKKKKDKKGKHSVVGTILKVLLLAILLFLIFLIIYIIVFVHGDSAINLDDYRTNQAQTSIIYAKNTSSGDYEEISRLHGEQNRIWVSIDDIPKDLQNSFICLEDKRFYSHHGVDWIRTIAAVVKYHGKQGGSTLTQQLIKNLTEENQVTVARKLKEILYALNLEKNYSKKEILEAYLNTIPLGQGCYGVQTAAQTYFGKDLSELNTAECAVLASITQAPTTYNPLLYPQNNRKRQLICLKDMYEEGAISKATYQKAVNYKLVFTNSSNYVAKNSSNDNEDTEKTTINSYYVDYVIDTVINDLMSKYNYTKSEATNKVYSGGLRIYTTENESVQSAAEYVYENRTVFPYESSRTEDGSNNTKKKVQSAITIMDYSGNVVAMVGGAGKKTINRGFNRATDAIRSPGSSIKPLSVYGPALEEGLITYSSPILNYALYINGKKWPVNYAGDYGSKNTYVTTQYALAQSLNTCSAQTAQRLTTSKCMSYLQKVFHITTLVSSGSNTDDNLSSMAVGGMSNGVTTVEMCAAYATFGNGGIYYAPRCYTKVTNYTGTKTLLSKEKEKGEQALSAANSGIMNHLLQTVVTEGTGKGCGVSGFTSYMKTGTTSDTKDKWACGGTPYYCAAVWYGYDQQETMATTSTNPAARVWAAVMGRAHSGLSYKQFTYSDDIVARSYCTQTGLLAGSKCSSTKTGYYDKHNLPSTCNGTHNINMGVTTTTTSSTTKEDSSSSSTTDPSEDPETPSSNTETSTTSSSTINADLALVQAKIN